MEGEQAQLFSVKLAVYPHTHTHTQPFYGSVDFARDNPGEPVPEGTFRHLLNFLEQSGFSGASSLSNAHL